MLSPSPRHTRQQSADEHQLYCCLQHHFQRLRRSASNSTRRCQGKSAGHHGFIGQPALSATRSDHTAAEKGPKNDIWTIQISFWISRNCCGPVARKEIFYNAPIIMGVQDSQNGQISIWTMPPHSTTRYHTRAAQFTERWRLHLEGRACLQQYVLPRPQ
jgi:hypothetical protein